MNAAERRVWAAMPAGTRAALAALPPTDLQTLLLSLARDRAGRVRPADLTRRWAQDRFVRPAPADPRKLVAWESHLWSVLPGEVAGVELSPVVPLGTCAAMAGVSQNRIVTTTRTSEVLSDATNALALEAAARRRHQPVVHLAASHRHLRAQQFDPGMSAHFRLFVLVSSARSASGDELLALHQRFWRRAIPEATLRYTSFSDRVAPPEHAREEPDRERGRGYYVDMALRLTIGDQEVGDGGFTTWTARLRNDAKERCLISCASIERLPVR